MHKPSAPCFCIEGMLFMSTEVLPCQVIEQTLESILKLLSHPSFIPKLGENVVWVQGEQHLRELYRREGKVRYPVMALRLDSGGKDRGSYHGITSLKEGFVGVYDGNKEVFYKWHLRPVVINVIVRFVTNSQADMLAMFNSWMVKERHLNFDLNYSGVGFPIGIHVEINDDVSFPPLEETEGGEVFNVETTLIVHTYAGEIRSVPRVGSGVQVSLVLPFQNGESVTIGNVTYNGDSDE